MRKTEREKNNYERLLCIYYKIGVKRERKKRRGGENRQKQIKEK